jgi:hypothetical protein
MDHSHSFYSQHKSGHQQSGSAFLIRNNFLQTIYTLLATTSPRLTIHKYYACACKTRNSRFNCSTMILRCKISSPICNIRSLHVHTYYQILACKECLKMFMPLFSAFFSENSMADVSTTNWVF